MLFTAPGGVNRLLSQVYRPGTGSGFGPRVGHLRPCLSLARSRRLANVIVLSEALPDVVVNGL